MGWIDAAIIAGFVIYAIVSGIRSREQASENLEEYFLAGRSLPGWKAGISMAATQFAADTPLLVTGLIATAGIFSLWRLWIYALAFLLMGFVLAGSWRRAQVLTDAELTEVRYGSRPAAFLRGAKAIYFGTLFNCTVLAMVLLATTRIAEPFLLWDQWLPAAMFTPVVHLVHWVGTPLTSLATPEMGDQVWVLSARNLISIAAILAVTTFYSTTGGLRSVVNTDVMQFALMMAGTALFAWFIVRHVGGLGEITARIHSQFAQGGPGGIRPNEILSFTPSTAKGATLSVCAVFALQWLVQVNADGTGYLAQRSMACRSDRDARQAAVVFTVAQVLVRSLLWLPIGLGLLVVFHPDLSLSAQALTSERESTFVRGMAELLPVGVLGLMLTGMLAALASTVDTHLNWGSSYWTNDIYKRFVCPHVLKREPSAKSLVWVARGANFLILGIALLIMTHLDNIQSAWKVSLLLGAGMGVVLVLRWVWWRINAWGELACIGASLVLAPVLLTAFPAGESEALRLLLMAAGATGAGVLTSLLTPAESPERLAAFYDTVRPPGFWGPVAATVAGDYDGPRRLGRGLASMVTASFSIFCLLTALGSLIAGSPAPTWFPWRGVWIGALFVVGAGLVPVWWKMGRLGGPPAVVPADDADEELTLDNGDEETVDDDVVVPPGEEDFDLENADTEPTGHERSVLEPALDVLSD